MSDGTTVGPGTQAGSGGQSPAPATPAPQGNTFNPHTTVRSTVPQNASYMTDKEMAQRELTKAGVAPTPEPEADLPRHATQPRDERGRWTAEEIAQAAADGYDVEGLEPGMEHPSDEDEVQEEPQPTFRIKVHGEEMEVDYATAKAELEMNFGAKKLFSQLDQQRREFMAAQEQARTRPDAFLKHLGIDPEAFAVQYLNQQVQLGTMSKEQRALYDQQQALQQREQQIREYEQRVQLEQKQQRDAETLEMLRVEIPQQLEAVGLPTDGSALPLLLPLLREAEQLQMDITPEVVARAAALAKKNLELGAGKTMRGLKGQALVEFLGPEVLQEVRRMDLEAARRRKAQPPVPREQPQAQPPAPQRRPVLTEAEFREMQKRRGL